jgi:hypothetical protein
VQRITNPLDLTGEVNDREHVAVREPGLLVVRVYPHLLRLRLGLVLVAVGLVAVGPFPSRAVFVAESAACCRPPAIGALLIPVQLVELREQSVVLVVTI